MSGSFLTLSRAMFRGFVRDRAALFFTMLFPLMFLVLFGGIFKSSGASKVDVLQVGSVAVIDQLPSSARAELASVMSITHVTDEASALTSVRKGDDEAAIIQAGNHVTVYYSQADSVQAATVQGILSSVVQNANLAATGQPPAFTLATTQVEDQSLKAIQYVTPGLLSWAIATGATFGAALTLVTWRQKKILRRIRLAPVGTSTVVGARVGVSIGVAFVQTAIFIGIAVIPYFGLKLSHYWWMAIPVIICGTLAFLSIGLLAGAWAKTPEAASGISNIIVLPMAFLSGAFFPLDNAPVWLKDLSTVLPMRHMVTALLNVMVRGEGPASALPDMGILLAFALVLTALATQLFRWDDI